MYSPLEQFEIKILMCFQHSIFDFTTISFYLIMLLSIVFYFFFMSLYKSKFVPTNWQLLLEFFYKFIVSMVKQQAGKGALNFFPIVFVVFFFILFCNLIGLLPFGVTVTAQLINTFLLALSFNLGFIILGFFKNGFGFLRLFVPSDAPKVLIPLIVCIELVSYTIRTFSLSLRLFANMMAGHTLLHILTSFVLRFWYSSFYIVALFPLILVLMITVLEFGIAFLQAYVFSILLCIYLNDSLHPGH